MASVLVTGCSSGIGLATALSLGRAGHTVYATMRNPDRSPELGKIAATEKLPVSISVMDVTSDDSVRSAIAGIHSRAGQIDVLVNNAGIDRIGSVEELPFEAFREAMETNYFGALRCIKALLPGMRARRNGCIVNVTSIAGRISASPMAPYSASKFALEGFSEALAQEMKPFNIRVAIVQPGIIDTPMARRVEAAPSGSLYPQTARFAAMFEAALENPAPPSLVGDKIREIIESGAWQLRHPVGPDAEPFLGWRASMTDEDWVSWGALEEEDWYQRLATDFGLHARPKQSRTAGA